MVDSNTLKQLEDVLLMYQENQETLTPIVEFAEKTFGDNWMSELTEVLETSSFDPEKKRALQDKADHAIHYYGALAAWDEASAYLERKVSFDKALLQERLPVLEYWLSLFGAEGATLVAQVRNLVADAETNQTPEVNVTTPAVEEDVKQPSEQALPNTTEENSLIDSTDAPLPAVPEIPVVDAIQETVSEVVDEKLSNGVEEQTFVSETTQEEVLPEVQSAEDFDPLQEIKDETTPIQTEQPPVIDQRQASLDYDVAPISQNWEVATFLRQKRLYEDATNWLNAWCIRMDTTEKMEYPYYGFIVDLMYDLKEKIQAVLENQLLEEVVDKEVDGGREAIVRLEDALNKEIEGLPDDFKHSTAEKIKLSAREILGEMDTSTEKEYIGTAPDGFEVIEDPYAVSTDKIISDFEKTEQEAQNKIDNLNVIDENQSVNVK